MKCTLSALFLAWPFSGQSAFAQFIEPDWWPLIAATITDVNLKQCGKRLGVSPIPGTSCASRPKTCFFGDQYCNGGPYPAERCDCADSIWQCDPVACPATPAPTCGSYDNVVIDFETGADGSALAAGAYVSDEWSTHGITVSASSATGFTPDNKPRLFDTASPGTELEGDPDLGSPNQLCNPAGPGVGAGGVPGSPGENCDPQGLVLIIQESDTVFPDDNVEGGMVVFDFAYPTDVNSLGLMDMEPDDSTDTSIEVTRSNGEVVLFNPQGLGENSVEDIVIDVSDATQVKITFSTSGAITNLDLCVHPPATCTTVLLDFETRGDGTALAGGEYVQGEWSTEYGVSVSASSATGFTPGDRPRLFDTATPGTLDTGDPDLGSPNQLCNPAGPGVGAGGVPGSTGENCDPQGLVLIIQESDKVSPDDNVDGGMIIFDFSRPTDVISVGLMDIEDGATNTIDVTMTNDAVVSGFNVQALGDNSVQSVVVDVLDAKQAKVTFSASGAVTHLELCVYPY